MTIRVLIFASLAQRLGASECSLDLTENATVSDALALLTQRYPALAASRERLATAVNLSYVGAGHALRGGDELALIPPVSGG
jgi:molybdopterin converting factor subunit 1